MKTFKRFIAAALVFLGLGMNVNANAGIPVIDAAALTQAVQQVAAWAQQYQQMASQIQNLERSYAAVNGARSMGSLVNNPLSRQYLPAEYQTMLNQGVGQWETIRNVSRRFDISGTTLATTSDAARAFNQVANQAAINRASAEMAYNNASQRFGDIQVLLDRVNYAPDAKDMADLQGRIQAEQVMMQNEANKLQMLQQLAAAQKDLQVQQSKEISMKSLRGGLPAGW